MKIQFSTSKGAMLTQMTTVHATLLHLIMFDCKLTIIRFNSGHLHRYLSADCFRWYQVPHILHAIQQ